MGPPVMKGMARFTWTSRTKQPQITALFVPWACKRMAPIAGAAKRMVILMPKPNAHTIAPAVHFLRCSKYMAVHRHSVAQQSLKSLNKNIECILLLKANGTRSQGGAPTRL